MRARTFFARISPYLAFAVLLFVFFHPVFLSGRVLAPLDILELIFRPWSDTGSGVGVHNTFVEDAISQYLPYNYAVFKSLRGDGFIGWCPGVYAGYSLYGNTMVCPGDWHHQLYRFLPFWTAWNWGLILQFAIAGFGMAFLLASLGMSAAPALAGAVAYAFYSQHVTWIYHRWVLGASCWFPWMTWAVRNWMSDEPRPKRRSFVLAFFSVVFTALALRGGHLQACLFTSLVLISLFVESWWRREKRWSLPAIWASAWPLVIVALGASILSADVMLSTIPPFLSGCRNMAKLGWRDSLPHVLTYASAVCPTAFGTPQSLDVLRLVRSNLLDVTYAGCVSLMLALCAFRDRKAPLFAKVLIVLGLCITATPLLQWFYSRSTVVMALGVGVLAAQTLENAISGDSDGDERVRRACVRGFAAVCAVWFAASIAVTVLAPRLSPFIHDYILSHVASNRTGRLESLLGRGDAFLVMCRLWHPQNLSILLCIAAGLLAWRRIGSSKRLAWVVPVAVFLELFFYSRSWITFSERPGGEALYAAPARIEELRRMMEGKGYVMRLSLSDGDFFQPNTAIGNDMVLIQGYETIYPNRMLHPEWRADAVFHASDCAAVGVSHAVCQSELDVGDTMAEWRVAFDDGVMRIYENPLFDGLHHTVLENGRSEPIRDVSPREATSRLKFFLPPDTVRVDLLQSFDPKWRWRLGPEDSWHRTEEGENHTTTLTLAAPSTDGAVLELSFFRFPFLH